jgi:2-keto-4-pentenoate hydratase/2-oxohepta-3-ene-1,7-dioic acid hydratase in catechol pathway
MRIASVSRHDHSSYGLIQNLLMYEASADFRKLYPTLKDVIAGQALSAFETDALKSTPVSLSEFEFLPPIPNAERVICVGINFPKRYPLDGKQIRPENIILFSKLPGTLVGHQTPLEIPSGEAARSFDYEGELAVVIGSPCRHLERDEVMDHIAGYTVFNDGSVRDWQKHSVHAGKNFANSGACGPYLITADEVSSIDNLTLTTRLNGEIVQQAKLSEMFYSIIDVVTYVSHMIPLGPGDIIAMGSPDGSGGSRTPQRFLVEGDHLAIEIETLGSLHNSVGR